MGACRMGACRMGACRLGRAGSLASLLVEQPHAHSQVEVGHDVLGGLSVERSDGDQGLTHHDQLGPPPARDARAARPKPLRGSRQGAAQLGLAQQPQIGFRALAVHVISVRHSGRGAHRHDRANPSRTPVTRRNSARSPAGTPSGHPPELRPVTRRNSVRSPAGTPSGHPPELRPVTRRNSVRPPAGTPSGHPPELRPATRRNSARPPPEGMSPPARRPRLKPVPAGAGVGPYAFSTALPGSPEFRPR